MLSTVRLLPVVLITGVVAPVFARPLARPVSNDRISRRGFVESVQSARFASPPLLDPTVASRQILDDYVRYIDRLPFVRTETGADGRTAFKLGPVRLVQLGPVETGRRPGVARRRAEGGLLILRSNRGRAVFEVAVKPAGNDAAEVSLRLGNYQPALRGSARRAPLREALYRATQLPVHRWAGLDFLRKLAISPR